VALKARKVCVRTLPCMPSASPTLIMASSLGASTMETTSWAPSVQNMSRTVALFFFATSLKASLRLHLVQRLCNGLLVPELKKVPPSRGLLRL
jgi:hypothetical protein